MPKASRHRPTAIYFLIGALFLQGISGLAGGVGLASDPSGANVQMPVEWLAGTPFSNYLIPGVILFVVLGIVPCIATYAVWRKLEWAWAASLAVSTALIIWIAVQITMIGYFAEPPLQAIYGGLGIFLMILTLAPSTRRDLDAGQWLQNRLGLSRLIGPR